MELKEYLQIIKKNVKLFLAIIILIVFGVLTYFYFIPERWDVSLTLNITRSAVQETPDYRYDDFYRLQADEKFSETVVEWIKSPRVEADVFAAAGIDTDNFTLKQLSKSISAEKRSSQIVAVKFSSPDEETAQKISSGVAKIISQNTAELNKNQKEDAWFQVVAAAPVIVQYRPDYAIIFSAAIILGIFLGFWGVLIRHYLEP